MSGFSRAVVIRSGGAPALSTVRSFDKPALSLDSSFDKPRTNGVEGAPMPKAAFTLEHAFYCERRTLGQVYTFYRIITPADGRAAG